MAANKEIATPGRALGEALRAYYNTVTENQRRIVESYVGALVDNALEHAPRMAERIAGATRQSRCPVPPHILGNALAEWENDDTKREMYQGMVGQKGGRPQKFDSKKPLGVNRVAADVAALVRAADKPTEFVEEAIRHYAASRDK